MTTVCTTRAQMILLVVGVMDLRAMLFITTGITIERFTANSRQIARVIGVGVVAMGLFLVLQAMDAAC